MFSSLSFLESRALPTNYTQAFSLTPSGNWDGNDGAWSTFMIRVGTPAQLFRVLPSTSGTKTWIPIPDNCNAGISWCGNARGVEPFNGAGASPFSGTPNGITVSTVDAGVTCTANKSPMCVDCLSINGRCTNGPCTGRSVFSIPTNLLIGRDSRVRSYVSRHSPSKTHIRTQTLHVKKCADFRAS